MNEKKILSLDDFTKLLDSVKGDHRLEKIVELMGKDGLTFEQAIQYVDLEEEINLKVKNTLIIGGPGTSAYILLKYLIWCKDDSNKCLCVEDEGNTIEFLSDRSNTDVMYIDEFNFNIEKSYDYIFLNSCSVDQSIKNIIDTKTPTVLRALMDDISKYSLRQLKDAFDLIVITNPYFYDNRKQLYKDPIKNLIGSSEYVERLTKREDAIIIYQDKIMNITLHLPQAFLDSYYKGRG